MINLNGKIETQDRVLSYNNRGFKYGDGVFDTLKYVNGKIFFWEDHYLRLMAGMRIVRMEIPMSFTMDYLQEQIMNLLEAKELTNNSVRVRITVFRKEGGFYSPSTNQVDFLIEAEKLDAPFYLWKEEAYEIDLYKDYYVQADLLSTVKRTCCSLHILGGIYAQENGYDNCLLVNHQKNVVGALNANLFVVKGNLIKTPALSDGCLNGVTRKNLIKIIEKIPDYQIEESQVSPFELQKSDELFLTNSIMGIRSITKYRKKEFSFSLAKSLVGKLNTTARLG